MKRFCLFCCFVLAGWLLLEVRCANLLFAAPPGQNSWNIVLRGTLGSTIQVISAHGSLLLAVMGDQVVLVDVSNPAQPQMVSTFTSASVTDAVLTDELAYLLKPDGLEVLDMADPLAPTPISFCDDCGGYQLDIVGARAYVLGIHQPELTLPVERLRILDLSNPRHPALIGTTEELRGADALAGDEQHAYVAYAYGCNDCGEQSDWQGGLYIISADDPTVVSTLPSTRYGIAISDLVVQNGSLFQIGSDLIYGGGLEITSLVNPLAPTPVGFLPIDGALRGAIAGNYAYVLTRTGLLNIDIANPQTPALVGQLQRTTSDTDRLVAGEGQLYWASQEGLTIVDVNDPHQPAAVGHYGTALTPLDVTVDRHIAYIRHLDRSTFSTALRVYNLTDPVAPVELQPTPSLGDPNHTLVHDGRTYATYESRGLSVYDLTSPTTPIELGFSPLTNFRLEDAATAADGHVYLYGVDMVNERRVQILDATAPASITTASGLTMPGPNLDALILDGEQAYALGLTGDGSELSRSDLAQLPLLRTTNSWPIPFRAWDMAAADDLLLISGIKCVMPESGQQQCDGRLGIYDVSQPGELNQLSLITPTVPMTNRVVAMAISGTIALLTDGNLHLFDFSEPAAPMHVGQFDCGGNAGALALVGSYVYLPNCADGLQVIDITNPAQPFAVGSYPLITTNASVALANGYLYLADGSGSVHVLDVADPAAIVEVSVFAVEPTILDVAGVVGHYLLLKGNEETVIVDISNPAALREVSRSSLGFGQLQLEGKRIATTALAFYELGESGKLTVLGRYPIDEIAMMRTEGRYAYLGWQYGLQLLDVADPTTPVDLGYFDRGYPNKTLAVAATKGEGEFHSLFVASTDGQKIQLQLFAVPDLTQPIKTVYEEPFKPEDQGDNWQVRLVLRDQRLFYLSQLGLMLVFDLSDPANPLLLGEYHLPYASTLSLDAADDHIYAGTGEHLYMLEYLPYHQMAPLVMR